ncbi:uncharacterized protein LOC132760089 [Ruditapes philippinarum]|uniref:uncharacterized protein LOC132760089 n=1 Tax=Ruditapes philippinarum TaxID=129788 RepID=UPI00295B5535|nr:uncharacterized protein LOC132760089 [Ruditapes philippinarum]
MKIFFNNHYCEHFCLLIRRKVFSQMKQCSPFNFFQNELNKSLHTVYKRGYVNIVFRVALYITLTIEMELGVTEMMFCYLIFVFGAAYCYNFRNNDTCLNFHVTSFNTCVGSSDSIKLTPISRLSLYECVSQCAVRGNCAGLIYRRKNLFCQLFKDLNSTQEAKGDCVYIKRSDIFTVPQSKNMPNCENENEGAIATPECSYPEVDNGKPVGNMFIVHSIQTIQCNQSYFVLGSNKIYCTSNLTWSSMPECYKECIAPEVDNADVDADMEQLPARATVSCHENFISTTTSSKLYNITEESLICDKTGKWVPDMVCTSYLNIFSKAFNRPARQSSTYRHYQATLATDGLWNPDFRKGSCMHTNFTEDTAWWEVDMLEVYPIRRLIILNRGSVFDRCV